MLISNLVIEQLIKDGKIKFSFFNPERLGLIEYHITPFSVAFLKQDDEGLKKEGQSILFEQPYVMDPKEYICVTIKEKIELEAGIFAQFYPASVLLENGIILSCGWLRPGYKDEIRLGLFNASDFEFKLESKTEIARMVFFQLPTTMPIDNNKGNINPAYNEVLEQIRMSEDRIIKLKKAIAEEENKKKELEGRKKK